MTPRSLDLRSVSGRLRAAVTDRPWHVAFAGYGAAFAVFILSGAGSPDLRSIAANVWYVPIGAVAAVLAWQVSRTAELPRRQCLAWRLLALASVCALASDALWIWAENVQGQDPSDYAGIPAEDPLP